MITVQVVRTVHLAFGADFDERPGLGQWRPRTVWRDPFRQFWFDFRMYFML